MPGSPALSAPAGLPLISMICAGEEQQDHIACTSSRRAMPSAEAAAQRKRLCFCQ